MPSVLPATAEIQSPATLLPRMMPAAAATAKLLHDRRFSQVCEVAGLDITLVEVRCVPPGPLYRLELRCDTGTTHVTLAAPHAACLQLLADGRVPRPLLEAGLNAAFAPALEALQSIGFAGMRAADLQRLHDAPAAASWLVIRDDDIELAIVALPELQDGMQHALRRLMSGMVTQPATSLRGGLALRGMVELSTRPVRCALLPTLARGDVLLLNAQEQEPEAPCRVRFGAPGGRRWTAAASVQEETITLQGEPAMADDFDERLADPVASGPANFNDLEIPVRFEVETVPVPLHELESMLPGAVISLTVPLSSASLRLVAGGRIIGQAELVAVGDRLGARILRIALQQGD